MIKHTEGSRYEGRLIVAGMAHQKEVKENHSCPDPSRHGIADYPNSKSEENKLW